MLEKQLSPRWVVRPTLRIQSVMYTKPPQSPQTPEPAWQCVCMTRALQTTRRCRTTLLPSTITRGDRFNIIRLWTILRLQLDAFSAKVFRCLTILVCGAVDILIPGFGPELALYELYCEKNGCLNEIAFSLIYRNFDL